MATIGFSTPSPIDVLARTLHFKHLEWSVLEALVAAASPHEIEAGAALFRSGEPFDNTVYILYAGRMRQRWLSGDEQDVPLGDVLALANYLDRAPHRSSAEAITDCALLGIAAEQLDQLEQQEPALFNSLNRVIAHKLRARNPVRDINRGALAQPAHTIMTGPVATCAPDTSLQDALTIMHQRHIGSLVICGNDGTLAGLLTHADLSEAMLLHQAQPKDPVITAGRRPQTVEPDTPLWALQDLQRHHRAKYVVVVDQGHPLGIVSQTDILGALIASPSLLAPHIQQARNLPQLAQLKACLAEEADHIRAANRWARDSVRYLSETHRLLQRRVIELTLEAIQAQGDGPPPLPFSILIMGSGGRKEMLLHPDQDNGIVIADGPEATSPAVTAWFERFAQRLNANLDEIGYPLCPGDIMARNPGYRMTLAQWKKQIDHLVDRPTEQAARWSNILFDFDTLYGDDQLTADMWRHVRHRVQDNRRLLKRMAEDDARGRPALGMFNQLVATSRDASGSHIDLKRNGLRLIADATRIMALYAGVAAQNTHDRLAGLVRVGQFSEAFSASVADAYDALLDLLLTHQTQQAHAGEPFDTRLDPKGLTEQSRVRLRLAMRVIKRLQERLQKRFGVTVYY